MPGVGRPQATDPASPTVHNEGPSTVSFRLVVDGECATVESVTLTPGDSHVVSAGPLASIAVHTSEGSATASAASAPLFVVREGRVLVAPESG